MQYIREFLLNDDAWIVWSLIAFGAILTVILWGFILPLRKRVKKPGELPMSIDEAFARYGAPTGILYSQTLIKRGVDKHGVRWSEKGMVSLIAPQGGLFRIDCGINIPPSRTVGAIYRTPTRLQGKAYVYPVGNYCPHPQVSDAERITTLLFKCLYKTRKDFGSIERGVEPTLPVTPEKQKGDNQPLQNEARREMQQRRRPRRVLMPREHPSDYLLGHGITSIPEAYGLEDELRAWKGEDDA